MKKTRSLKMFLYNIQLFPLAFLSMIIGVMIMVAIFREPAGYVFDLTVTTSIEIAISFPAIVI